MPFELFSAEKYRALGGDAFEARRALVVSELENPESTVSTEELRKEVELIKEERARRDAAVELRNQTAAAVKAGSGAVVASSTPAQSRSAHVPAVHEHVQDVHDTAEYRDAFMNLVTRGIETRADNYVLTTDAPVAIPTTLSNQIIEKLDTYGEIYPLVSKTNLQGAVEYPLADFDFEAKWVGEEEATEKQKAELKNKISFSYHEFEARVGISFLATATTFDSFQSKFVPKMSKAIVKLLEEGIIKGTGTGQMLGIVNDPRITNIVEMTAEQFEDWQEWHATVDAAILPEYDNGGFLMPKTTWNKHIDTMADSSKAPIAQFTYDPVSGKRVNHIIGKDAKLLASNLLPDFDKASAGDVVAIYGDLSNYNVNWQPGGAINILRYPDYDKRKNNILGYGICDGKVLDPYGLMLIKKKASA